MFFLFFPVFGTQYSEPGGASFCLETVENKMIFFSDCVFIFWLSDILIFQLGECCLNTFVSAFRMPVF